MQGPKQTVEFIARVDGKNKRSVQRKNSENIRGCYAACGLSKVIYFVFGCGWKKIMDLSGVLCSR